MVRIFLSGYLFFVSFTVAAQLSGTVVSIADGDTFTLMVNKKPVKIRMHGVDSPEKKQPYGEAAKKYLSNLIFNQVVEVRIQGKDRYRRTIGIVSCQGVNINEKLLATGLAWHFKKYDRNPAWAQLEVGARKKRIGLWAQDHPIPPWEFRKPRSKE